MSNPYGTTPSPNDDERISLIKIVDLINSGGGGGGGLPAGTGAVMTGAADPPVAPPSDPTVPWLYFPTGGGTLYQWTGAAWV